MTLDEACLIAVVFAALCGAFTGALSQLAQLCAAGAGFAGSRLFGPRLSRLIDSRVPLFVAPAAASLIAFVVCATVAGLAVRALLGAFARRERRGGWDRALGALLGGGQAALVLWVALTALAVFGRPLKLGPVVADPRHSDLVAFARRHGAFARTAPDLEGAPRSR